MQNWLRDYRLVAGPEGGTGFEIGEEKDGRAIHIHFSCEKSDGESNNDANITIWNLNETPVGIRLEELKRSAKAAFNAGETQEKADVEIDPAETEE